MKGDFTRQTFDPRKHYRGVLMQQGRVQTDADWNEQQAIDQHCDETEARDVIGPCGAPKPQYGGGFKIEPTADGKDLKLSKGRIYVDGILCENELDNSALTTQPDFPANDGNSGTAGFTLPTAPGRYLAYLDVWQRHLTALEDPAIRETALGGPDTATRVKTIWQVKLFQALANAACSAFGPGWTPVAAPSGKLNAHAVAPAAGDGLCVLPASAGFRRLENQLYRVEVHRGGSRSAARFKWSRDNGSVATSILGITGLKITVRDTGRDEVLGFARDQWVEIIDDTMDLSDQRGHLVQIDEVNFEKREITVKAATPIPASVKAVSGRHPILRRWDQSAGATTDGLAMVPGWFALEDGIEVQFSDDTYRAGDYWLVPARTAISAETGTIEWPTDAAQPPNPLPQPPRGIAHHYCALALVDFDGATFKPQNLSDCRDLFPPLTDITASDVSFDNRVCQLPGGDTVQGAIEALCHDHEGCCTLTAHPGQNLQALFDQLVADQDAHICLPVGTYHLPETVTVADRGNLRITGCGAGTRLLAPKHEAALFFQNCKQVTVKDLYAESGATGAGDKLNHLNGTLTFLNCQSVTIEGVALKCAPGAIRRATCVTVRDARPLTIMGLSRCSVRILHCDAAIGHQQTGILLVDVGRATVEDNLLRVTERPPGMTLSALAIDKRFRSRVRRLLISNARLAARTGDATPGTVAVTVGAETVRFVTHSALVNAWQPALHANPPPAGASRAALLRHIYKVADRIILNAGVLANADLFKPWFDAVITQQNPSIASQGIVVGGRVAHDIRIAQNTVEGTFQGIHVGVSHHEPSRGIPDRAGSVSITNNRVKVFLSPLAIRERHGILVGNCDTLLVENNHIVVQRFGNTSQIGIDGVRVHGHLGLMMIVRQNHLVNVTVGVRITPLFHTPPNRGIFQWLVAHNMMPNAAQAVIAPATVKKMDNVS